MTHETFWAILWGEDASFHEVRLYHAGRPVTAWIPCPSERALNRLLDTPECEVSAVPRTQQSDLSWGRAHILWCHLKTGDSCHRLERFSPPPTFVMRAGRTVLRWAVWALSAPLWGTWVQRATERLAYHLGGFRRAAAPEALIPSPFTSLGRHRLWIEYETDGIYTPRQIVGGLREAPSRDAWRRAA